MKKYKVGLLGLGVVATAFIKNIQKSNLRNHISIEKILVANPEKPRDLDLDLDKDILTTNFKEILDNKEIIVIIELIGGDEPAHSYIKQALIKKIPVITANKSVIANYGCELINLALINTTPLLFEASVGGGIPIIRNIISSFHTNKINKLYGIANGTSNFILTKILEDNLEFEQALMLAQSYGFAESDPSLDIDGYDSLYKAKILAALCFQSINLLVKNNDIYRVGISSLTMYDVKHAIDMGYTIKPIIFLRLLNNILDLATFPALLKTDSSIANINDINNIFEINSEYLNVSSYTGPGAGGDATAASIINDLINLMSNSKIDLDYYAKLDNIIKLSNFAEQEFQFYMNCGIANKDSYQRIQQCIVNNSFLSEFQYLINDMKLINNELEIGETHIIIILNKCSISQVEKIVNTLKNSYDWSNISWLPIIDHLDYSIN